MIFPYMSGPAILWQVATHFYFNLPGGYLGIPPKNYADDKVFQALAFKHPNNITSKDFMNFIHKHHITEIIFTDIQAYNKWLEIHRYKMNVDMHNYNAWLPIIESVSKNQIKQGGITIYTVKQRT